MQHSKTTFCFAATGFETGAEEEDAGTVDADHDPLTLPSGIGWSIWLRG